MIFIANRTINRGLNNGVADVLLDRLGRFAALPCTVLEPRLDPVADRRYLYHRVAISS